MADTWADQRIVEIAFREHEQARLAQEEMDRHARDAIVLLAAHEVARIRRDACLAVQDRLRISDEVLELHARDLGVIHEVETDSMGRVLATPKHCDDRKGVTVRREEGTFVL